MKPFISIIFLFTVSTLLLFSCKKDENTVSSASSSLKSGKWKVTKFIDSGDDELSHFTGFEFTFSDNGTVVAQNGSQNVSGTWNTGIDDSKPKLFLNFGSVSPFDDLNEDWHILDQSGSKIILEHISGGNGGTDYLNFEKV